MSNKKRIAALVITVTMLAHSGSALALDKDSNIVPGQKTKIVSESKETGVLNKIEELSDSIDELLSSEKVENFKDKAFDKFSVIVDFVFYDQEINGLKFKDLTKKAQAKLLNTTTRYFPHFKEDISNAYSELKNDLKGLLDKIDQGLREYLEEETYEDLQGFSESLKDVAKEAWDLGKKYAEKGLQKGLDRFTAWYEKKKNGD